MKADKNYFIKEFLKIQYGLEESAKILDKRKKHIFPYCEEDWNNKFKSLEKQAKVSLKALEMAREEALKEGESKGFFKGMANTMAVGFVTKGINEMDKLTQKKLRKIETIEEAEAPVGLETINKVKFKVEEASLFLFAEWHYSINNADNKTERLKYLENVRKEFKERFLSKPTGKIQQKQSFRKKPIPKDKEAIIRLC